MRKRKEQRKERRSIYLSSDVIERIQIIGIKESRMFSQMASVMLDIGLKEYEEKENKEG